MWKCLKNDVEKLLSLCGKICRKLRQFPKTSYSISDVEKKQVKNSSVSRIFEAIHSFHIPYYNHTYQ